MPGRRFANLRVACRCGEKASESSPSDAQTPLVVQENHYDPFGLDLTGLNKVPDLTANRFKYIDRELQEGLGWYDLQARFYDPANGRFLQVDPITNNQEHLSVYNYGYNNPVVFSDPNGRCPTCPQGKEAERVYAKGATVFNKQGAWEWTGKMWKSIDGSRSQIHQRELREENKINGDVTGSFYAKFEVQSTIGLRLNQEGEMGGVDVNPGSGVIQKLGIEFDSHNLEHSYGFQKVNEGLLSTKRTEFTSFAFKGRSIGASFKFEGSTDINSETGVRQTVNAKGEMNYNLGPLFIKYESDLFSPTNVLSFGVATGSGQSAGLGYEGSLEAGVRLYIKKK